MPLARIVTEFPDEAVELAMRLRSRGFQVETVSPKTTSQTAVDLEVRLEECAVEDVLMHATEIAAGEEVCVFVAPGALEENARFDATFAASFAFAGPVKREFAPVEDEEEDEAVPQEEPVLEEAEAPTISLASAPVELADSFSSVFTVETSELNEGPMAKEESVEIAETVPQSEISESAAPAIAQTFVLEGRNAPESTIPEAISQTTFQAASDAVAPLPPEARYRREAAALIDTAPSANPAARAVPSRADADRGERAAHTSLPALPQFARTRPVVRQSRSRTEADRAFWRIAVASAALATLVVLVGTVWHRARPTPANLGPSAGQQLPFHEPAKKAAAMPVSPKRATVKDQATAGAPGQSNTSAPAAAPAADGIKAASVLVPSSEVERLPAKAAPAPHKRAHSSDAGMIAEDTVIFYDRKPSPAPVNNKPAVKQHSDLR